MPKPKFPRNATNGSKRAPQALETENDYLEVADEHEMSGGKWRAGDSAKSARFFVRAIEVYDQGLRAFPKSFDLAYNKARLMYDIAEDQRIAPHFNGDQAMRLDEALTAHRLAMQLDATTPDVLFNMSQVLTSIVGLRNNDRSQSIGTNNIDLLKEASDLLSKCWRVQRSDYNDHQSAIREQDGGVSIDTDMAEAGSSAASEVSVPMEQDDNYATVSELVTPRVLLDTLIAHLGVLALLADNLSSNEASLLSPLVIQPGSIINAEIPALISLIPTTPSDDSTTPTLASLSISNTTASFSKETDNPSNPHAAASFDAALSLAKYHASISEYQYRSSIISSRDYGTSLASHFDNVFSLSRTAESLSAYADALSDFVIAVRESSAASARPTSDSFGEQWTALNLARDLLLEAIKASPTPPATQLVDLYKDLGDIYMLRFTVANVAPASERKSDKELDTMLKSAGVYYRGAGKYAGSLGSGISGNAQRIAEGRAWVAEALRQRRGWSDAQPGVELKGGLDSEVQEMIAEGLLDQEVVNGAIEAAPDGMITS